MSRFTSHLGLIGLEYSTGRPVLRGGRCLWYHASPLAYEVGELGSGELIVVPAFNPSAWTDDQLRTIRVEGVTDLASIPACVRWLLPPDGPWAKAAALHDAGYITRGWGGRYTRKQVDQIFLEAMGVLGVPAWKREAIYQAVRLFGASRWGT